MIDNPETVADTRALLERGGYLAGEALATAVFLALKLERPLLLEGEAGVGKTEIARVLAAVLGRDLVRLQCYEGLGLAEAAYEWNYQRQLLHIRAAEAAGLGVAQNGESAAGRMEREIYGADFLLKRPLLKSIEPTAVGKPPVLLIDELDRADEPFEAFLLEFLADYQMTIPELGTIKAERPPITILTSNRTREVHDAVRRRCFYHWVEFPSAARELAIVKLKVPQAPGELTRQLVAFVQALRAMDLYKTPGIAESINWAQALTSLDCVALDPERIDSTIGTLLKYQDDIARIRGSEAARLLEEVKSRTREAGLAAEETS
ncbi:MAG: AAA domain-containing protein [Rhizobiales bacterium]|nr:AAA domain-containing protein [Hyphomicrobiales bacterium]